MAFAEDLSAFLDVAGGFALSATLEGDDVQILFDAPGTDALGGDVVTTEPSALVKASDAPAKADDIVLASGDLPAHLVQHAGTYRINALQPEPPDGAFVRCFLVKTA